MSAISFKNQEQAYQNWLEQNPHGFVLTTLAEISTNYMSLHRSRCRMISRYMKNMAPDAFTGQGYIKVCANSPAQLLTWIRAQGGTGFTKRCSICAPGVESGLLDEAEGYRLQLDAEVERSRRDGSAARLARLAIAPKKAAVMQVTTTVFRRNADVIVEVLERANGICEQCAEPAPFRRASDGSPYLEVHHRTPLADGGDDSVDNAVALCPNCHRDAHFGPRSLGD